MMAVVGRRVSQSGMCSTAACYPVAVQSLQTQSQRQVMLSHNQTG